MKESMCFVTPNVATKCRGCGQMTDPAHVSKMNGEQVFWCSRRCPLCGPPEEKAA